MVNFHTKIRQICDISKFGVRFLYGSYIGIFTVFNPQATYPTNVYLALLTIDIVLDL